METTIFEREEKLGGVPRYVIPAFRIPDEAIDKDISIMERLGVTVKCGAPAPSVEELKKQGYTHILMATGAWQAGELGIPGNVKGVIGWMKEMKQQVKQLSYKNPVHTFQQVFLYHLQESYLYKPSTSH